MRRSVTITCQSYGGGMKATVALQRPFNAKPHLQSSAARFDELLVEPTEPRLPAGRTGTRANRDVASMQANAARKVHACPL